jgi:DNA-directed RNA polymerase subunit M/transcription elongation factor TFIIS
MFTRKASRLLWIVVAVLLLSGCISASMDQTLTVARGGSWESEAVLTMNLLEVEAYGLETEIANMLIETQQEVSIAGVNMKWDTSTKDDSYLLTVTADGDDFNSLSAYSDGEITVRESEWEGKPALFVTMRPQGDFFEETYRLRGGTVFSSNSTQTDGDEVVWNNPRATMEAVVSGGSSFNWAWLLVPLVVVLIGAGGWYAYKNRERLQQAVPSAESLAAVMPTREQNQCPQCSARYQAGAQFCGNCGSSLTAEQQSEAVHCPNCQTEIPGVATFCPACGHAMHESQHEPEVTAEPVQAEEPDSAEISNTEPIGEELDSAEIESEKPLQDDESGDN